MSVDEAIACIQRGACPVPKRNEGCATCDRTDEAIRVLVAEGARRALNRGEDDTWRDDLTAFRIAREVLP